MEAGLFTKVIIHDGGVHLRSVLGVARLLVVQLCLLLLTRDRPAKLILWVLDDLGNVELAVVDLDGPHDEVVVNSGVLGCFHQV